MKPSNVAHSSVLSLRSFVVFCSCIVLGVPLEPAFFTWAQSRGAPQMSTARRRWVCCHCTGRQPRDDSGRPRGCSGLEGPLVRDGITRSVSMFGAVRGVSFVGDEETSRFPCGSAVALLLEVCHWTMTHGDDLVAISWQGFWRAE